MKPARSRLLARAFARGIPYRVLELRTRSDNAPNSKDICKALWRDRFTPSDLPSAWLNAAVEAWLMHPAEPEQILHDQLTRSVYIEAKRKKSEEWRALRANGSTSSPAAI